jgi:hypothetical protein
MLLPRLIHEEFEIQVLESHPCPAPFKYGKAHERMKQTSNIQV